MELTFSEKMTKKEFLIILSFIEKWCDGLQANTIISGVTINIEIEDNDVGTAKESINSTDEIEDSITEVLQKVENEDHFIKYEELSKWMFIKEEDFVIPPKIKEKVQYVGITEMPFSNARLPVYSVEHYCQSKGIEFLKKEDFSYIPKHIAADIIPDLLDDLKVSAVYLERMRNGLVECFNLKDVQKVYNKPIYKLEECEFPLVSSNNIKGIIRYLEYDKPTGKLYTGLLI